MNKPAVLVTGAASGIGRAVALRFARDGYSVAVVDRDMVNGRSVLREIQDAGGTACFIRADVTVASALERVVRECVGTLGALDVAVNNAGVIDSMETIDEMSIEAFERCVAVNMRGVWAAMRAELAAMRAQGRGGAIINTSSINGLRASSGSPAYSATKFGVIGLTKCAAIEAAKDGIRVNAICPGPIDTAMLERSFRGREMFGMIEASVPLGRVGVPEEIADCVAFLASEDARFVTGHALVADGGLLARGGDVA